MAPAAQESHPQIRSRADQTTHAVGGRRCPPQPSSAVVSAVVVEASYSGDRVYPHTAFVLTWFKIKERQASVSELLRILKLLCHKGF